jgi:hypothetical protein
MAKPRRASPGRKKRPAQASPAPASQTPQTAFQHELTTKRRGEISELAFALAAARKGFAISKPFGDSERYDIILDSSHLTSVIPAGTRQSKRSGKPDLNLSKKTCFSYATCPRLVRVQVKSSTQLLNGLYHINAHRRINGRAVPYKLSEIDFVAAYIIPEDSWFILPLAHILGQTSLPFRPKRSRVPSLYDDYREAWHHLTAPDALEFA